MNEEAREVAFRDFDHTGPAAGPARDTLREVSIGKERRGGNPDRTPALFVYSILREVYYSSQVFHRRMRYHGV